MPHENLLSEDESTSMPDYLFIDTTNARTAATQLQCMATTGADHAAGVRRACALADLADTTSARLETVAEALADLARVLHERSDAADAGGLLPYRSTGVALANIAESLHGHTAPTVEELFPTTGPRTTQTRADPQPDPQCSVDDQSSFPWDGLLDPLLPIMEPLIDQPIMPHAWWEVAGSGAQRAWDVVDAAGHEVEAQLADLDWSVAGRFADRVEEAATDPRVVAGTLVGVPALPLEVASHYGIVGVSSMGYGVAYSRAGDGERRLGLSVPVGRPSPQQLLPTISFTPTNRVPQDGFSVSAYYCDVVCAGAVVNDDGTLVPSAALGPPGAKAGATYTDWMDAWPGDD